MSSVRWLGLFVAGVLVASPAACGGPAAPAVVPSSRVAPAVPIDQASLEQFVRTRFPAQLASGLVTPDFGSAGVAAQIVEELAILGITTIDQLAAIVPADFEARGFGALARSADPSTTLAGLLRDLMLIHDARGYVDRAWRDNWTATPADFPMPVAYGLDLAILRAAGVVSDGADDESRDE
ncbi:MAG: hypothetical protein R3B06_11680 [Kofleriaceae bacterium]